jgi:hypothetical protein
LSMAEQKELDLLGNSTVGLLDAESTRRALDELFRLTHQYNSTKAYGDLLNSWHGLGSMLRTTQC